MKRFFKLFLGLMVALAFCGATCGCDRPFDVSDYGYTVTLRLGDSLRADSATLKVVDDVYGSVLVAGRGRLADGAITFRGQTDRHQVAFVTFDSLAWPFYFVLGPGHTDFMINIDRWVAKGGQANKDYLRFMLARQRLMGERKSVFDDYRKMASDSTLTLRAERKAAVADSLLADSLQRLLLHTMLRGDATGRIVRERFVNELSPASLQQLRESTHK